MAPLAKSQIYQTNQPKTGKSKMKILVDEKSKFVRVGLYVTANAEANEIILNTDECELTNAELLKICEANKVPHSKKTSKLDLLDAIEGHVGKSTLPTANDKPASLIVKEHIEAHFEKEGNVDDEEKIMFAIMQTKLVKFKELGKLFNQAMVDGGYRVSAKDRLATATAILNGTGFNPANFADVKAMCERLSAEIPATEYSQAYAVMRKWAAEQKVDLPKPEKGQAIAAGYKAKIFDHMVKNPFETKDEFTTYVIEGVEKDQKTADRYWQIFEVAQRVAKAAIAAHANLQTVSPE